MRTLEGRGVLPGAVVAGNITLVLGTLFTLAVAWSYVLSLAGGVDPPDWARVVGLVWLPIGLAGVPIGYYWSLGGPHQRRAELGAAIAAVGVVAFVALVVGWG